MLRISSKWLSIQSKKIFESNYTPDKSEIRNDRKIILFNFFKNPGSSTIIIVFVLILFLTCIPDLNIPILFTLSKEYAFSLLNDRLTDIIALFSISIAIAVFIVSAVQAKGVGDEQFSTIFKESYLYPIIYFVLATISIIIFVSYTKDSTIISLDSTIRIVVLFFYMLIISIFAIGFLFYRIFQFLNTDFLIIKYVTDLKFEVRKTLRLEFIDKLSIEILSDMFNKINNEEESNFDLSHQTEELFFKLEIKENSYIKDINLKLLENILIKSTKEHLKNTKFYDIKGLNSRIYIDNSLVKVSDNKVLADLNNNASKIYKITTKEPTYILELRKSKLKAQLEKSILDNNSYLLRNCLRGYFSIYEAFVDFFFKKKINSENYNKYSLFISNWLATRGLDRDIFLTFKKTNTAGNEFILNELILFVENIFTLSLSKLSLTLYKTFIFFPNSIYNFTSNETIKNNSINIIITFILYELSFRFKNEIDRKTQKELVKFYYEFFYSYTEILRLSINKSDFKIFKKLIKSLKIDDFDFHSTSLIESKIFDLECKTDLRQNEKIELKNLKQQINDLGEPVKLYKTSIFSIYAWLLFLYKKLKISEEQFDEFYNTINLPSYSFHEKITNFVEFSQYRSGEFGWDTWGNEDDLDSGQTFSPISPSSWFNFAWIIEFIKDGTFSINKMNDISNDERFKYLNQTVSDICNYLSNNFDKWKKYLGNINEEDFNLRKNNLIELFNSLSKRYDKNIEQEIIQQNLSEDRILEFKERVFKTWNSSNSLHRLFQKFGNLKEVSDGKLKACGTNMNGIEYKIMFIEKHYMNIYGLEGLGGEINKCENNSFAITILESGKENYTFTDLNIMFENLIEKRKKENKETTLIIMNYSNALYKKDFQNNPKFKHNWKEYKDLGIRNLGTFDDIPLILLSSDLLNNTFIFTDFKKAFEKTVRLKETYFNTILDIQINEFSSEDAESMATKELENYTSSPYKKWLLNKDDTLKTKEEIKDVLKASVKIKVWEYLDLKIKDINEFDIGKLIKESKDLLEKS